MNNKIVIAMLAQIDKVVLVAALVLGGFLVWRYSMGDPFAVTIRAGKNNEVVTPAQVTDRVLAQANRLRQQLNSDRVPEALADFTVPDYTQDFLQKLDRSILPEPQLSIPFAQVGISVADIATESLEDIEYVVPTPPAPMAVLARASNGVLDDAINPSQLEQVTARIGDRLPRDFHYVSVAGQFDVDAWLQRMDSVEGGRAVPAAWQRSSLYAVDVLLERQRWMPEQGQWGPTQAIEPIPGQLSFRGVEVAGRSDADALYRTITDRQEEILRPAFLPLAPGQGPPWRAPDEADAVLDAAEHEQLAQLNRDIDRLTRRIETLERSLDRQSGTEDGASRRDRGQRGGSTTVDYSEQFLEQNGGGAASSSRPRTERLTPEEQLDQMIQDRDDKLAQRDALLAPVREGFGAVSGGDGATSTVGRGSSSGLSQDELALEMFAREVAAMQGGISGDTDGASRDEADVQVLRFWVHDIDVEPNTTYRYRVIVDVLNPLFRRQQSLAAEQRPQADGVTVRSEASSWTEGVKVDPFVRFFLVGASSTQNAAEIEVYSLYQGIHRLETFTGVQPGDIIGDVRSLRIGGKSASIDFSTGKALVDLEEMVQVDGLGSDTRGLFSSLDDGLLFERRVREDGGDPARARYENDAVLWAASTDESR